MDVEKICRTCLALSGPLLSIYDSAGSGSGCLADMLREFTKSKPQPNDMLPEKVCLTCISEINHCYSFKMKCENSNKTLRQLIPNAVKEVSSSNECVPSNVITCDTAAQTDKTTCVSSTTQTITVLTSDIKYEEMQTDKESTGEELFKLKNKIRMSNCRNKRSYNMTTPKNVKRIRLENNNYETEESYILLANTNIDEENEESNLINNAVSNDNVTSSCHDFEYYNEETNVEPENKQAIEYVYTESVGEVPSINDEDEFQYITNDEESDHLDTNKIDYEEEEDKILEEAEFILSDSLETCNNNDDTVTLKISEINKKEYKCPQCCMTFVSLKYLRRHLSTRHDIEPSSAHTIIQKEVEQVNAKKTVDPKAKSLRQQQQAQQSTPILTEGSVPVPRLQPRIRTSLRATPPVENANTSKLKYFCENCKAGFVWRKTLTLHIKQNVCKSDNYKCDICGRIFITKTNLETHVATHKNQHTCVECKKSCASIEDLSQHMIKAHNRKARNQCNVCKRVFTMKTSLIDHMRIHSGEKPFPCTVCGKRFRQNSNLRQHVMRHTNEKNFKCDVCQNAYVTKAELFSHKRTHTGDHPFKCEICNTRFTSSSSLQKHRRKHTGERPYACEFCPMRFTALNTLKNHRRTHTGEKPYQCELCEKRFSQKGDCQMHQRSHSAKPIACKICGAKFTKSFNLRQHVRTRHRQISDKQVEEERQEISEENIQITIMENEEKEECDYEHKNDREQEQRQNDFVSTSNDIDSTILEDKLALPSNECKEHTEEEIMKMACLLI